MKAGPGRPKGPERRRVQVTLPLETWQALEELANALKQPKAALIAELIAETLPALKLTVQALALANERPREAQRLVTNFGAEVVMNYQQQHLELDAVVTKKLAGGKRARTT